MSSKENTLTPTNTTTTTDKTYTYYVVNNTSVTLVAVFVTPVETTHSNIQQLNRNTKTVKTVAQLEFYNFPTTEVMGWIFKDRFLTLIVGVFNFIQNDTYLMVNSQCSMVRLLRRPPRWTPRNDKKRRRFFTLIVWVFDFAAFAGTDFICLDIIYYIP